MAQTLFSHSQIISHASFGEAEEALREAKVDALFGDALSLVYWTEGEASQGCCRLVPGAFVDEDYFSRSFAFFVRRGDTALKSSLDYGLDQASGERRLGQNLPRLCAGKSVVSE